MKLHTFVQVAALGAALGCCAKSTSAAPIVFVDRTAFHAAAGSTSVLTFDDLPNAPVSECLPASPYTGNPCELHYGGATFVATEGMPAFGQDPLLFASPIGAIPSNGLSSAMPPLDADDFYFTFAGNAVGFSIGSWGAPPVFIDIEDADGHTFSYSVLADPFTAPFFGVVSDVGLTKVRLYTAPYMNEFGFLQTTNFGIDDVELGAAVPEPSTLALMLGGAVAFARRRRRSNS